MCVCVCVFEVHVLKILNWETILRDYCVDWIIGWVAWLIAFMSVFFSSRKTGFKMWLDTSSTPCYLSSFSSLFISQSWQLLDTWWINRESSCLLDSFSTPGGSIELLLLDLMNCCSILARYLSCWQAFSRQLPRHLICRALLSVLFKPPRAIRTSFHSISLSIALCFLS